MADIISYVTTDGESLGSALVEANNQFGQGDWYISKKVDFNYALPDGTLLKFKRQQFVRTPVSGERDVSLENIAEIGVKLNEKILKNENLNKVFYPIIGVEFSKGIYWYLSFGLFNSNVVGYVIITKNKIELNKGISESNLNSIGALRFINQITEDGQCTLSDLETGNVDLYVTQVSCHHESLGTSFTFEIISNKKILQNTSQYHWNTYPAFNPDCVSEKELFIELGNVETKVFNTDYGDYSGSGGYGGGSFDDSSDAFGLPSLPSLGVSEVGFINVYNPTKGQLQGFADELFPNFEMPTPSTATGIEAVAENLANTFQVLGDFAESYVNAGLVNYVIDCHIVPVAPVTSGTSSIKVGFKTFNYSPKKVTSDYVEYDCGSLEIAEYYQNFLDYEGTKAKLYLPFIGFVDIKPEWFQSGKLGVTYHFNIIDGSCIAFVIATSSKSKLSNTVVATFGGNCCVHMPITGVNYSSMISGIVGGAVGIASNASNMIKTNRADKGTVMSNIEGATGIASNLADAVGAKPSIEQSNGYNAGMSFMCYRRPYLLIERPVASFSKDYPKEQGLPLNVTKRLGTMKGFTTCTAPVVDNFHCLEEEKEMIKQALIEGTIF